MLDNNEIKTVVILYEHVSREYETCCKIKEAILESVNAEVMVLSLHFQMDKVYQVAKKNIIDVLMVPYAYKEKSLKGILLLIKQRRIRLVFNLRHEQIGAEYNEHRLYPYDSFIREKVYHAAWTDYYKARLVERGVPASHVVVTHNPRADLLLQSNKPRISKVEFARIHNLDINKKWLLLCESGSIYSANQIMRMVQLGFTKNDLIEYNSFTQRDLLETEKQLNELPESFLNEYEIIYRPHPGTKNLLTVNKTIKVSCSESVYDWLYFVDVVVSRLSTVLFEAQAKGITVYRFCPNEVNKRYITYGLTELPTVKRLTHVNNGVAKAKQVYQKYIGPTNGDSIKIISRTISAIIEQNMDLYTSCQFSSKIPYRRTALRLIMSNKLSFIIHHQKLAFLRRLSKSLTTFENDIPPSWLK